MVFNRRTFLISATAAAAVPASPKAAYCQIANQFEASLARLENSSNSGYGLKQFENANTHDFPFEIVKGPATASGSIRIQKRSDRQIGDNAKTLIVRCEVTSQARYESVYKVPTWPQGASGVTIGIGYDVGYVTLFDFKENWIDYIPEEYVAAFTPAIGVKGRPAESLAKSMSHLIIGWNTAVRQFNVKTLPFYISETETAFSNSSLLPVDSFGSLVSLVYNRGSASYINAGSKDASDPLDRRREIREIKNLMIQKNFTEIPNQIRSMKRLWQGNPNAAGLVIRREAEALLFELGLSKA